MAFSPIFDFDAIPDRFSSAYAHHNYEDTLIEPETECDIDDSHEALHLDDFEYLDLDLEDRYFDTAFKQYLEDHYSRFGW
jgi:hypothetical protein